MAFAGALRGVYRAAAQNAFRYNAAWTKAAQAAADASGSFRRPLSEYAQQLKSKKQAAHRAIKSKLRPQPSILDFNLRFQFARAPEVPIEGSQRSYDPWAWGVSRRHGRCRPRHSPSLADIGRRAKLRRLLLQAYMGRSLRHTPQSCPAHGRARTTPWCGGIGGGRFRMDFDHARWRHGRHRQRAHHHAKMRYAQAHEGPCPLELATWFIDRQLDRGCRKIQHLNKLAPVAGLHGHASAVPNSNGDDAISPPRCRSLLPHKSPAHASSFLRPRAFVAKSGQTMLAAPPLATHTSFAKIAPSLNVGAGSCRLFSTSSCRKGPEMLLKAAFLLKSSTALHWINVLFRISVSFIPLSIKRASWARKAKIAQLATGAAISTPYWATFFKWLCRGALALPFVLLAAVLLAAIERTPITGRLRLLLLNQVEEADIVNKVLEIGAMDQLASRNSTLHAQQEQRDWVSIMRAVLGEQNAPEGTLLGGKILDSSDWRVRLVEQSLSRLERGVPDLNENNLNTNLGIMPPPLSYLPKDSARCSYFEPHNAVILIDRPESNAFSFGFYGSANTPQPGVVIVFTGAIDEIMSSGPHPYAITQKQEQAAAMSAMISHEGVHEPSWLRSFFGSIIPSHQAQQQKRGTATHSLTSQQEEALAVLLAHELAHLVLSHTIESYANTALLWPQLEKLGWDMLRVFIYPITAVLGPFVQDAISATVKVGVQESAEGRGLLPALTSSCESKKMEFEADTVALRLLANAGIDPRSAIQFWEERLFHQNQASSRSHEGGSAHMQHHPGQLRNEVRHMHEVHSDNDADSYSFIKTHPADRERIAALRKELARWQQAPSLAA